MTRHDAVVLGQHMLNVDAAIEAVGFGKMQFLLLLYTGLAWFADAMEVMILSYLGPAVSTTMRSNHDLCQDLGHSPGWALHSAPAASAAFSPTASSARFLLHAVVKSN